MAFTELYTNASTGSNMNGGSDEGSVKYAATNGGWNSGTGVFTPTAGDPSAVSPTLVGQMANVFLDGATTPVFVGRVTAVGATTLTVSTTAKAGTAPTTGASGLSVNVGGVWLGPNGAVGFPLNTDISALTNSSTNPARVNMKNNAVYNITAQISVAANGKRVFQGYTTTPGDGGKANIDGGTSGASYNLVNSNAIFIDYVDLIFSNNGATGSASGVVASVGRNKFVRCVFRDFRGSGLEFVSDGIAFECEAYACNQSNTANKAGFFGGSSLTRCVSHDNTGSNSMGFVPVATVGATYVRCIADTNGGIGFSSINVSLTFSQCDAYGNGSTGFLMANVDSEAILENCNATKNGGWGFDISGTRKTVYLFNCAYGAGTEANTSGGIRDNAGTTAALINTDPVAYASNATPYVDAANGDFDITLAASKGTGRGLFTQTAASYTGTRGYPDIGAAQHQESGGGGGLLRNPGLSGGMT